MRGRDRHDQFRERRVDSSDATIDGAGDRVLGMVWELGWGLLALVALGAWAGRREAELTQTLAAVMPAVEAPAALKRLTVEQLAARRRWLEAELPAYRPLAEPTAWARTLAHVARAIPEGARIERLEALTEDGPPGQPERENVLRVTALDGSRTLAWLRAEPYLARTFWRRANERAEGAFTQIELAGPARAAEPTLDPGLFGGRVP